MIDLSEIGRHFQTLHALAARTGADGKIILAGFGEGVPPRVFHFAVGDVAGALNAVLALKQSPNVNLYAPLALMRPDLPEGAKGGEADVLAVLGAIIDSDADKGNPAEPPVPAQLVIETSAGNFQHFLFFDTPLAPADAKPLLAALKRATGADCTDDISHVWRIPGTCNVPTASKLKRGRSPEPYPVRVVKHWDGSLTSVDELRRVLAPHWEAPRPERTATTPAGSFDVCPTKARKFHERLRDAGYYDAGPDARKRYVRAGKALAFDLGDEGRAIFESVVCWRGERDGEGDPVDANELDTRWADVSNLKPDVKPVTHGTLIDDAARIYGWKKEYLERPKTAETMFRDVVAAMPATNTANRTPLIGGGAHQPQLAAPEYAETEIAGRFVNDYSGQLSYIKARSSWVYWTGRGWQRDETDHVADLVRQHCQSEAALCSGTPGYTAAQARALGTDKTVNAVLRLAGRNQQIATRVNDWDSDPWLLGTPDGVVELKTGTLRAARPEDRVTKSTAVAPAGDCPQWLHFLHRATGGDIEMQNYLQRFCGYALTGMVHEELLHFAHGPGGAGKGTFVHAISGILGEYHVATAIATFSESEYDRHPAEIAVLQGARLVTCSETERGKRWADARIKEMTGSDMLTARFMHGNPFNFLPTFKIFVSGNYKPHLRPDSAMRRRFRLIPFIHKIPPAEQDRYLGTKLQSEWPGIFAWMIAGCVAWQRDGLYPPASVTDATDRYMNEEAEDCLAMWIADCCEKDPQAETQHNLLYAAYAEFAKRGGENPMSSKALSVEFDRMEFKRKRTGSARFVVGLKLRTPAVPFVPGALTRLVPEEGVVP